MTDTDTRDKLEADIAHERNALGDSIADLATKLTVDGLTGTVGTALRARGDDVAKILVSGAKDNPAAVAVMGAGLAWLLLGKATKDEGPSPAYDDRDVAPVPGFRHSSDPSDFEARVAAAQDALRENASGAATKLKTTQRQTAADMRARLYEGTADLGDMARERVVEARKIALEAQERLEEAAKDAARKGGDFAKDHPVLLGAGIAAAGAIAAMAMPKKADEKPRFDAHRDTLMEDADRILHEEMASARAVAAEARESAAATADAAFGQAVDMGDRLADAGASARIAASNLSHGIRNGKAS